MRKVATIVTGALLLLPALAMFWLVWFGPAPQARGEAATPPVTGDHTPSAPPATANPAPAPGPSTWAKGPVLARAVEQAMAGFPGTYSVVVQDLTSGERFALNPAERYHPASTLKLPVSLYALNQYRAGKLRWDELLTYTPADFESPGGGALETSPFYTQYTVENLVGRALRYSNNIAVNMLIRRLGRENLEAWSRTIGGDLYRRPDRMPEVTALSELGWWLHLNELAKVDPKAADLLLVPLREVAYDGRITAGLPAGLKHLHKFGSFDGYYHDGGIVYAEQPYVLIVMTSGGTEDQADAYIPRVSAAVYKALTE